MHQCNVLELHHLSVIFSTGLLSFLCFEFELMWLLWHVASYIISLKEAYGICIPSIYSQCTMSQHMNFIITSHMYSVCVSKQTNHHAQI